MPQFADLTGMRFGRLTVVEYAGRVRRGSQKKYAHLWLCACDCGGTKIAKTEALKYGGTKSCGCLRAEHNTPKPFKDLTGQRFGRLLVTGRAPSKAYPSGLMSTRFYCRCDCGQETIVDRCNLISGNTTSCGCRHKEIAREHMRRIQKEYKRRPRNDTTQRPDR